MQRQKTIKRESKYERKPAVQRSVAKVREVLEEAGLDPRKYAGHNFRIGAVTTAAACGVEDSVIKTLGHVSGRALPIYFMFEYQGNVWQGYQKC